MPPAVIGGVIAGVGAVGAAAIGSKAASKAAKAQTQAADQSAQVQREIYGENKQTLAPFVQQGGPASYAINSFLGLTPPQGQQTQAQPNALAQFAPQGQIYEGMDGARGYPADVGNIGGGFVPQMPGGGQPWQGGPMGQVQSTQPGMVSGPDAFKTFLGNSDYGFQFQEGANAINSGYAGAGTLQSGAAMKALEEYRQNLQSGYRGEFLNALGNQQGVGLSAAGAQAGVGVDYANSLGAINQNRADGISNAAFLNAQNTGRALNSLATIGADMFGRRK